VSLNEADFAGGALPPLEPALLEPLEPVEFFEPDESFCAEESFFDEESPAEPDALGVLEPVDGFPESLDIFESLLFLVSLLSLELLVSLLSRF